MVHLTKQWRCVILVSTVFYMRLTLLVTMLLLVPVTWDTRRDSMGQWVRPVQWSWCYKFSRLCLIDTEEETFLSLFTFDTFLVWKSWRVYPGVGNPQISDGRVSAAPGGHRAKDAAPCLKNISDARKYFDSVLSPNISLVAGDSGYVDCNKSP